MKTTSQATTTFTYFLIVFFTTATSKADIYEWEDDGFGGRQESTTLVPDGAGKRAVPYADLGGLDLTKAWFVGKDLTGANLGGSELTNADFTGAVVQDTRLVGTWITEEQLYSTASYQAKDLTGIWLGSDLTNWNFAGQNLTNARLLHAQMENADLTGAVINGANMRAVTQFGFTKEQLYSTASYQAQDLTGIRLQVNDLIGWNFVCRT